MTDPLFSKLTVAVRAGLVESGFDRVKEAVQAGRSALVIIASDISAKTKKEVKYFCGTETEVLEYGKTMDEFTSFLGMRAAVYSVNDPGFAKAIKKVVGSGNGT